MNVWIRRTIQVSLLSGGFVFAGAVGAQAHVVDTGDNEGVANANQVVTPIQIPISICGNAVGSDSEAYCDGGAAAHAAGSDATVDTGDNEGIGNAYQTIAPVQIPIDISGNTIGHDSSAESGGGSMAGTGGGDVQPKSSTVDTLDNEGLFNAGQYIQPVQAPVDLSGNVLGHDSAAQSVGGSAAELMSGEDSSSATLDTLDNEGVGNANQVIAPVQIPVNVCGNAVGEDVEAACDGGAAAVLGDGGSDATVSTGDNEGLFNAGQYIQPIQAPIDISGNVLGEDSGAESIGGSLASL